MFAKWKMIENSKDKKRKKVKEIGEEEVKEKERGQAKEEGIPSRKKRWSGDSEDVVNKPEKKRKLSENVDSEISETKIEEDREKEEIKLVEKKKKIKKKLTKENKQIESNENNTSDQTVNESEKQKKRFIVFVGNLPYDTTKEELEEHFKACKSRKELLDIRLLTKKGSNEPRGCAFVEFKSFEGMKIALSLHHSDLKGRRINVEMTAGAGGNSEKRKEKIKKKNEKFRTRILKKTSKSSTNSQEVSSSNQEKSNEMEE
jgi:nucleolar protein 6